MIGQKGLPATFGGVERHVEELGARLVERGVRVSVYCRQTYDTDDTHETPGSAYRSYRGMTLVTTPTIGTKHLDAIVHSATSTAHALRHGADILHYHAMGPAMVAPVPRYASRAKVALTVHGLDHQRAKWGGLAKVALGTSHWLSGRVPDEIITVSQTLAEHYRTVFGRSATYIPNGFADPQPGPLSARLRDEFGLAPGSYVLSVSRLVPEKRIELLIDAIRRSDGDTKLVVVGGAPFGDPYVDRVRAHAQGDPRVVFLGFVYQPELGQLFANTAAFVTPSALEGLPLTLLEALSYGVPVLASDIGPHQEVIGSAPQRHGGHRLFTDGDLKDLTQSLQTLLQDPTAPALARAAAPDLLAPFSWDAAADQLVQSYRKLLR